MAGGRAPGTPKEAGTARALPAVPPVARRTARGKETLCRAGDTFWHLITQETPQKIPLDKSGPCLSSRPCESVCVGGGALGEGRTEAHDSWQSQVTSRKPVLRFLAERPAPSELRIMLILILIKQCLRK